MKAQLSYILMFLFTVVFFQARAEQPSVTLTRTATSGSKMETQLSQDIYKSVPYQATYEEQEAYSAQEDYTVDIPYQDTETYYVDIPYQETEDYYEQIPYQETESYLDYETYYENEYTCRTVTEYEQQCRTERLCSRRPGDQTCQMVEECGTNALGKPICKTRKVCENGPDREDCENKNVCTSIPRSKQECRNEQVAKTRPVTKYRTVTRYRDERRTRTVTKYREEARTRTVTRYRQETRTRTVTKYRTVTKCCVTEYKSVFDYTWRLDLKIILPAQATLLGNESETFHVALSGTPEKPDVILTPLKTIYGYKVGPKQINASSGLIELMLIPKYNQQSLGEKLLEDAELTGDNEDSFNELIITDRGLVARVTTLYRYRVLDTQTKQTVAEGELSSENAIENTVTAKLSQILPSDSDYIVQISATRSGIVLEKSFSFSISKAVQFKRLNPDDYSEKTLKNIKVLEQKEQAFLLFNDEGAHPKLVTQYKISIENKNGNEVFSKDLFASDILDANKKAQVALDSKVMSLEEDLTIRLTVSRTGKRIEKPLSFQVQTERIYLRLEDLKNKKRVSSLSIQGRKEFAKLVFQDQIKDSTKIQTEYKLTITRNGGFLGLQKKIMAQVTFNQTQMKGDLFSEYLTSLGVSKSALNDHLTSNSTIYLDLTVSRKNTADKKVIAMFRKSVELKIEN